MKHLIDFIKNVVKIVVVFAVLTGSITLAYYYYNVRTAPYTKVYDGDELIYEGNSYFYVTSSRGNATMVKVYEQTPFFPRQLKEVMSHNIRIVTVNNPEQ